MAILRSQPYRLDWKGSQDIREINTRLGQFWTNADEMFQILFGKLKKIDQVLTTLASSTTINSGGSANSFGTAGILGLEGLFGGSDSENWCPGPPGPIGRTGSQGLIGPPGLDGQDGEDVGGFPLFPPALDLSGFVPYVGATSNVNLGAHDLTVGGKIVVGAGYTGGSSGDISIARAGGGTSTIYLDNTGNKYIYWNGGLLSFPENLEININQNAITELRIDNASAGAAAQCRTNYLQGGVEKYIIGWSPAVGFSVGDGYFYSAVGVGLRLYTNGSGVVKFNLDTNGNVGIGTLASGWRLQLERTTIDTSNLFLYVVGASSFTDNANTSTQGALFDVSNYAVPTTKINSGTLYGQRIDAHINNVAHQGILAQNYGQLVIAGIVTAGVGGNITSCVGGYFLIENASANGSIDSAYGLYVDNSQTVGTITNRYGIYQAGVNANNAFESNVKIVTAGSGLYVKEGANATMGVATLIGGTIVVNTTKVTANSRIFLTPQTLGTILRPVAVGVTARTAATSFTITSMDITDTSDIGWIIVEPV